MSDAPRAAVTGGAGFIGSHLVDALLNGGYDVIVIDDFSSGSLRNLSQHEENPKLQIRKGDVMNQDALAHHFRGCRFVFHLATRNVRLSINRPTAVHDVNATGTFNALKAAVDAGVEKFMYVSSSEVRGDMSIREKKEFAPETIYGASKLAGEYYTGVFQRSGYIETVIARPYNNYGPRSHYQGHSGELIPRFITAALSGKPFTIFGDGNQSRDFVYVKDTADAMIKLMGNKNSGGKTFEICSGAKISVNDIAEKIASLMNIEQEIKYVYARPSDLKSLCGDTKPLQDFAGIYPETDMDSGLAQTIKWFKQNFSPEQTDSEPPIERNWLAEKPESWMPGAETEEPQREDEYLQLAKPYFDEAEENAAASAVRSRWVTQGPRVQDFEERFADFTGAKHACAVSSCTAALHLSLLAAGVGPGDVVLTVSHSFIATANSIRHCGAEPVFIDIASNTLNMDPRSLESAIRSFFREKDGSFYYSGMLNRYASSGIYGNAHRLSAILVVHQAGIPADMKNISAVARAYRIPLIEDAACAVGSALLNANGKWENVGAPHSMAACFSFHPRKIITTGEGGMITTRDPEFDNKVRLLRHHGMSASDMDRHGAKTPIYERYLITGYNYRMSDIHAAVGIEQLRKLPAILDQRRELAEEYEKRLKGIPGVEIYPEPEWAKFNYQSFIVGVPIEKRDHVVATLNAEGIGAKRGISCAHLEPPYSTGRSRGDLPRSERASDSTVILPLHGDIAKPNITRIVAALRSAVIK